MKKENLNLADIDNMIALLTQCRERLQVVKENKIPEFYMITVRGENGSKVRHENFDAAVKEATRLAKKLNHTAHIMGVVAVVEPVQVQQPIIEYKLKTK